ncbi:hypothetical protein SAMN06269185_0256 [Natronoarchaeum philippinense]|uniref:Uncharacterized protein n=1 Tax=Natronoarchaeum philippinense TaxID=558529 RepID=A0A285N1Z8_NATPI|nr:hypothetical protein [Natronoarchaeum philippinense]SNZ03358.1 hypothetical protein SAMN06269185_0256 [Natronoarchaeum philippinense]
MSAADLHDGVDTSPFLVLGALLGAIGWAATQYVAWNPGVVLGAVGVAGTTAIVLGWLGATLLMAAVGLTVASRAVRYSPPLWVWSGLVGAAIAVNLSVVLGVAPRSVARYALWHPWMVAFALGFALTAILARGRNRLAYAAGSASSLLVLAAAVVFPAATGGIIFLLTGVVHAGPLLVDAYTAPPAMAATDDATPTDDAASTTARNP